MDVWLKEWGDGDHDMAYDEEEVMEEDDDDVCDLWQLNMKWMKKLHAWWKWKVVVDFLLVRVLQ